MIKINYKQKQSIYVCIYFSKYVWNFKYSSKATFYYVQLQQKIANIINNNFTKLKNKKFWNHADVSEYCIMYELKKKEISKLW